MVETICNICRQPLKWKVNIYNGPPGRSLEAIQSGWLGCWAHVDCYRKIHGEPAGELWPVIPKRVSRPICPGKVQITSTRWVCPVSHLDCECHPDYCTRLRVLIVGCPGEIQITPTCWVCSVGHNMCEYHQNNGNCPARLFMFHGKGECEWCNEKWSESSCFGCTRVK